MGGVMGAVSGKFVITAAGLLVTSTVDRNRVQALIDPAAQVSAISSRLASKLDKAVAHPPGSLVSKRRPIVIGIRRENFGVDQLAVAASSLPEGIDFIIGRDVLAAHVFDLDLRHDQIRILLKSEYRGFVKKRAQVPLVRDPDGGWSFSITINGVPRRAVFDLASLHAISLPPTLSTPPGPLLIGIGPVVLQDTDVGRLRSTQSNDPVRIGLEAFGRRHVTLDLPHSAIWLSEAPRTKAS